MHWKKPSKNPIFDQNNYNKNNNSSNNHDYKKVKKPVKDIFSISGTEDEIEYGGRYSDV
jgi:hypothetical protein